MRRLTLRGNSPAHPTSRRLMASRGVVGCCLTALVIAGCSSGGGSTSSGAAPATRSKAATPTPSHTPAAPPKPITVGFTGDILLHAPVFDQAAVDGRSSGLAYDFRPMFAQIKPLLTKDDLAICHQETALSSDDVGLTGYPVFNSPHEIAPAVKWAGYQGCSTASNHSYDHGATGVADTIHAFEAVGVEHSGTALSAAAASKPELHTVRGVKVALLDYTYGLNGFVLPANQQYLVNLINVPRILRDAHAAREAGANIVIVQMHWGEEYQATPTPEQRMQATQLLASPDIDAIVGGHVHVVQPVEKIGSKYVVYGTGNLLSNQTGACCPTSSQDGVLVTLHFTQSGGKWSVHNITYTPTYVDIPSYVILPDASAYESPSTSPLLKQQLAASFQRTVAAMSALRAPNVTPDATPPGL